jgi:hypothetical protein
MRLLLDVIKVRTAERLGRLFQALALNIKQPAMKQAAKTTILQSAETQICTAMRTSPIN